VGTLSGHGFHPLKAQLTPSTHEPQLVRPQGRTPFECQLLALSGPPGMSACSSGFRSKADNKMLTGGLFQSVPELIAQPWGPPR
jgi:hypothetical protein